MGKPLDAGARPTLRCVHCRTSETPLWRTGPDGAKTLCNACGVRFKKGKLALYRDAAGALTAVKQPDTAPVVVPPPTKKAPKKNTSGTITAVVAAAAIANAPPVVLDARSDSAANQHTTPATPPSRKFVAATPSPDPRAQEQKSMSASNCTSGPASSNSSGHVRKLLGEASIATTVAKKIRSRARRMTAGQLPGRYQSSRAASLADADMEHMQYPLPSPSPPSSMHSAPASPRPDEQYSRHDDFMLSASAAYYNVDDPTPYQFTDSAVDHMFADVACLGLDNGNGKDSPNALSLPPMAADPSSAEHFSLPDQTAFPYSPSLVIEPPDQRTALISLIRDRSRAPGRLYHACVRAIAQLGQRLVAKSALPASSSAPERRQFVRDFAADNNVLGITFYSSDRYGSHQGSQTRQQCGAMVAARLMLPDRTAYDTSVDAFRAMCDCAELAIFPEDLVFQVLEDDVEALMSSPNLLGLSDADMIPAFAVQHDHGSNPVLARA